MYRHENNMYLLTYIPKVLTVVWRPAPRTLTDNYQKRTRDRDYETGTRLYETTSLGYSLESLG